MPNHWALSISDNQAACGCLVTLTMRVAGYELLTIEDLPAGTAQ